MKKLEATISHILAKARDEIASEVLASIKRRQKRGRRTRARRAARKRAS